MKDKRGEVKGLVDRFGGFIIGLGIWLCNKVSKVR